MSTDLLPARSGSLKITIDLARFRWADHHGTAQLHLVGQRFVLGPTATGDERSPAMALPEVVDRPDALCPVLRRHFVQPVEHGHDPMVPDQRPALAQWPP